MNRVERIIDANQNRCVEGLRVIEEYARFLKDDKETAGRIRGLRHYIRKTLGQQWVMHRDSANDVGVTVSKATVLDEKKSIAQVLKANASRVSESLRVMEEYLKVLGYYELSKAVESKRFEFYQIEKVIMKDYYVSGLYALTADGSEDEILSQVDMFIRNGVRWLQYRDKQRSKEEILAVAKQISERVSGTETKLIINDYPEIAEAVSAHGVHVGQDDITVSEVREEYPTLFVGVSTHNHDQFDKAVEDAPDYIALGPIFETKTKANPEHCDGVSFAQYARKKTMIPLVGIGGIDKKNINRVLGIGIDSVAMIASIKKEEDLTTIQEMIGE